MKQIMRILQIVPSYKPAFVYGGPIESVARLCEGLTKAGVHLEVITTTANGKSELPVQTSIPQHIDGVHVTYFKRITKDHSHISPALWHYVYKNAANYDIVHIQSWWNPLVVVAAAICHAKGVKVLISPRGMLSKFILETGNTLMKKIIHNTVGKKALIKSVFHATAESELNECLDFFPDWNGFVVPNVLALPPIDVKRGDNSKFILLFLSRIHPKKGLEMLIEAISKLNFDVLLRIAGEGDDAYLKQLKELSKNLGVEEKIEWLGWRNREEKFNDLMHADLFCLTSYNENFANVVIESLHVGTPVLVSDSVALSSFVRKQNVGWVCELSVGSIIKEITDAHDNFHKRTFINKNSRDIINQNFSEPKLIATYLSYYNLIKDGSMKPNKKS